MAHKMADHFQVWWCDSPECGPHIMSYDGDDLICETIVSRKGSLDLIKHIQDMLYAKATGAINDYPTRKRD